MTEEKQDKSFGKPIDRWRMYRDYLQHEDDLIHQRLNWMLLLQGFFFSAYAAVYAGLLEHPTPKSSPTDIPNLFKTVEMLYYVLPVLGYTVSLLSLLGIHAARSSIERLALCWKREHYLAKDALQLTALSNHFPLITGGGAPHVEEIDSPLPYGIPIALCIGWICLTMRQSGFRWQLSPLTHWLSPALFFLPLIPPTLMLAGFAANRILRHIYRTYLHLMWLFTFDPNSPNTDPTFKAANLPLRKTLANIRQNLLSKFLEWWKKFKRDAIEDTQIATGCANATPTIVKALYCDFGSKPASSQSEDTRPTKQIGTIP